MSLTVGWPGRMVPSRRNGERPAGRAVSNRHILLIAHTGRADIVGLAGSVSRRLSAAGITVDMVDQEAADLRAAVPAGHSVHAVPDSVAAADGAEMVLVLGGDGTFLRAAEYARPTGAPLFGVNLGRVGFLAEVEPDALDHTIDGLVAREYDVESRLTLDVTVYGAAAGIVPPAAPATAKTWALNEASLEKSVRERMLEVVLSVDGRTLTSFGADGVLCATPTGSTAYAFSAGGPVVWPSVDALLVVPNNAHAVFARPLVVAPESVVRVTLASERFDGLLSADGRRRIGVPPGGSVEIRRGRDPVRVVQLHPTSFTERLVEKFALPVSGFRDRDRRRDAGPD